MRKLLLLAVLCATVTLALTPAAGATSYAYRSCAEIPTQELAQGTLESPIYGTGEAPGASTDPLNLDPDGDGVACNDPGNLVGGEDPNDRGPDLACVDFTPAGESPEAVQAEAQAALDADPGDPNDLDADGDGVACEFEASSTGEVAFEDGSGMVADSAAPAPRQYERSPDLDCAGFGSREEAQAALDADPTDPGDLDADADGVACNELFSAPPTRAEAPTAPEGREGFVSQTDGGLDPEPLQQGPSAPGSPAARQTTGMQDELPATGGTGLALPLPTGALLLSLGVLTLVARRRSV